MNLPLPRSVLSLIARSLPVRRSRFERMRKLAGKYLRSVQTGNREIAVLRANLLAYTDAESCVYRTPAERLESAMSARHEPQGRVVPAAEKEPST